MVNNQSHVDVGLQQECVLPHLLFIIFMNWMDKLSRTEEGVTIGRCKISRLLFANDLVLLVSLNSGFQHALNGSAAARDIAGMKINTSTTEVLHLLRNSVQYSLQVGGVSLNQVEKFNYLGVAFIRWFGHVSKMPHEWLPKQTLYAKVSEKRPVGRPRTRWLDYIEDLDRNRLGLTKIYSLIWSYCPRNPPGKAGEEKKKEIAKNI